MRVMFGHGFDGGVWPAVGLDADAAEGAAEAATFDEAWVGRRGLLRILETSLGLGSAAADVTNAERAASLLPSLRARAGAWSRSLDTDPLAVARALLRLRDLLVDSGLDPRAGLPGLPPRLREIVEVTAGVPPGEADRLRAVATALEEGAATDVRRLELFDEQRALSVAWNGVVEGLRRSGVDVIARTVRATPAHGDLLCARSTHFSPAGDGSLLLLRSDCPEEAAFEVAAHLASLTASPSRLVIGGDAVLDGGLARMGLPTLGARGGRGEDGLLQVAPLVVALGWPERDPERAFELLTLSCSPVRRAVATKLARALTKEPAVDSDAWRARLEEALAGLNDDERARASERVDALFGAGGGGSHAGYERMSLEVLDARLAIVRAWLFGRIKREADPARLRGALAQVAAIARVARAFGAPSLSRVELMRVVEQATSSVRPLQPRPSQAGLFRVADPASVTAPAAHVVWWGFLAASESVPFAPAVTGEEQRALMQIGVHLPDAGAAAERRAAAFGRPLLSAASSLVLVCPRRDEYGDDAHPHPLWDEIVARAGGDGGARKLEVRELPSTKGLQKKHFRGRDTAQPVRSWVFPAAAVARPARESPSSREILVGCSVRAVFERSGLTSRARCLPQGSQLFGSLAHDVIGGVLEAVRAGSVTSPLEASIRARALFDEAIPRRAAVLARPEEATQRARAREQCARAAERLVDVLGERGFSVVAVEQEIARGPEGRQLVGRPDLVVQARTAPPGSEGGVVLDLKSGGDRAKRKALEDGLALQLVAYAGLLARDGEAWPGIGYFQIRSRRLLTTDPPLGGAHTIEPALTVNETAARLKKIAAHAEQNIERGHAQAPGVGTRDDELHSRLTNGDLVISPPCRFCQFAVLCGRALPNGTHVTSASTSAGPGGGGRT
jgi:hypothetical protein